jgi:hypothetical protein
LAPVYPAPRPIPIYLKTRSASLAVKLKTACFVLGDGETKIRQLVDKGELDSFLDDGVRKITWASIVRRIAKLMAANENAAAKTAAAVEASLKLAQKRRLEKARQMAAERRAQQMAARGAERLP